MDRRLGRDVRDQVGALFLLNIVQPSIDQYLQSAVQALNQKIQASRKDELIDVQARYACLEEAAKKELAARYPNQENLKRGRDSKWYHAKRVLARSCKVVYSYATVMDVLVASHPEIASLAWGAMKFLVTASINHQELKEKFAEHLADIGEQFETIHIQIRAFPEDRKMVDHVLGACVEFLSVLQACIDWWRENGFVKFLKSVAQPYSTRIKPKIDNIARHVRLIKERTDAHNACRIFGLQIGHLELLTEVSELKGPLRDVSANIVEILHLIRMPQVSGGSCASKTEANSSPLCREPCDERTTNQSKASRIEYFRDNDLSIFENESSIKTSFFPELLSTATYVEDIRLQCKQLLPSHSYCAIGLSDRAEVRQWAESKTSQMLWIDGFSNPRMAKWTTQFSIDVVAAASKKPATILYHFGDIATENYTRDPARYLNSPLVVLHAFIAQLVEQNPSVVEQHFNLFTRPNFESARRSMRTSWDILKALVISLPAAIPVYIIVDSIDTIADLSGSVQKFNSLLRILRYLADMERSQPIKVLLTSVTNTLLNPYFVESPKHAALRIPHATGRRNPIPLHPAMRKMTRKRQNQLTNFGEEPDEDGMHSRPFSFDDP